MIKHHPTFELLQSYVNGELPASLAIGVSIHAELCAECQKTIALLTEQVAEQAFEAETDVSVNEIDTNDEVVDDIFELMMQEITASDQYDEVIEVAPRNVTFRGDTFELPTALSNVDIGYSANIGKLSRSRIKLDENEIHTNLLHINPGGGVPSHTHKGFELTVLLDGSFSDDQGEYTKGDFIMLNGEHTHSPISVNGCLCYTVANDALHFTHGINKLLNPIGNFIY
ncbi:ChrR family anti-sigma-E factor [Psychromonas aquatilis]|uniref:ChrR family anti-sigma-E factor n=1 Tax=Psychromonas aquatilis TaxID=2005072 RepID=A0ABU9GRA3_9GAMM